MSDLSLAEDQPEREISITELARILHEQGTIIGGILDVQVDHQGRITTLEDTPKVVPVADENARLAALEQAFIGVLNVVTQLANELKTLTANHERLAAVVHDDPF